MAILILSKNSTQETENFLRDWLKNNPKFKNKVFSVGGYVRDKIWGYDAKDLDLIVDIPGGKGAETLSKALYSEFGSRIFSLPRQQANYPIWKMTFKDNVSYMGGDYYTKGEEVDFADPQKETFTDENSRQRVTEPATLQEDIERRDFTINTLLQDLTTNEVVDLTGYGIKDLEEGKLRINPNVSWDKILSDDPLRMIRAIRFYATKSKLKSIPREMLRAIKKNSARIKIVSEERIMAELIKVMKVGKLHDAVKLMKITGLLQYIFPEVQELMNVQQRRKYHQEGNVYKHTMLVLKNTAPGVVGQMAALLHDVGKAKVTKIIDGVINQHNHEGAGAELSYEIMKGLKFPNDVAKEVAFMVQHHMHPHVLERMLGEYEANKEDKEKAKKAIRRFIYKIISQSSKATLDAILDLAHADSLGRIPSLSRVPELRIMIEQILEENKGKDIVVNLLNGDEIMALLNMKPGKEVGEALKFVKDMQLDNSDLTAKQAAYALLQKYTTMTQEEMDAKIDKVKISSRVNRIASLITARKDIETVGEIKKVAYDIIDWLQKHKNRFVLYDKGIWIYKARDMGIDDDLLIGLVDKKSTASGYGSFRGYRIIILNVLTSGIDDEYFEYKISGASNILVHELTHHYDHKRRKTVENVKKKIMNKNKGFIDGVSDSVLTEVYNLPEEVNAFFNEAVNTILNSMDIDVAREALLSNYKKFEKSFMTFLDSSFVKYLSSNNLRRIKKRIYDLYIKLTEKYS